MPKVKSQSMIRCSSGVRLHLPYAPVAQPEQEQRGRIRYGQRSLIKHAPAERRQEYYRLAFLRISPDDMTFLKQAQIAIEEPTVEEKFRQLANELSRETRLVSSLTAITAHPKYRQIVNLGWEIVPLLIDDMAKNKRFWLPALREITGIQPYDSADAGNSKIMIEAWVNWGKRKYKQADKWRD